jgi:ankyrin repeat protein
MLVFILCIPVNLEAQIDIIEIDTSEYLPLAVPGALEYNLMLAALEGYYTEVERMILKGAEVDSETNEGVTPLIYAVINNKPKTVLTLLQYDADVNKTTGRRESPLLIAVKNENFEIAEILIRYGADVNYQSSYGAAPLHFASVYGFLRIADLLLYYDAETDIRTNDGTTPLMAAIWAGYADVMELLIRNGANMETRDNEGFTPFLIAAQNGDTLIMEILREKGVDIYEKNLHNWDALDLTIRSNQEEAAKMLLRIGDRWNDPDRNVINPYSVAITYRDKEMIDLLEKNSYQGSKKPNVDQVAISLSFKTDFRDFYSGFNIAFKEPLWNIGIISGFDTKPWYTRVLIKEQEGLFYQYFDKSSLVYAGIFKEFQLTDNLLKSNYSITTSLSAGYSFGNKLTGTLITPEDKFRVIPAVSFKMTKEKYNLITGLEFTNTDFYKIGPMWWKFGIQYNLYFNDVRAPLKDIKWY